MLELGISQAQTQFTQLLTKTVLIVDKKAHRKKAVILPYVEYQKLLSQASRNTETLDEGVFSKFVGILYADYETDDVRYNAIVN
jgi:macrodomain Ter protein organizer (MatP/YcbG family)